MSGVRSNVTGRVVPRRPPTLLWLATLALAVAAAIALGCDARSVSGDAGAPARDLAAASDGGFGPASTPGGRLPPGWEQRGCGWDAPCGDPWPGRTAPSDEVRP